MSLRTAVRGAGTYALAVMRTGWSRGAGAGLLAVAVSGCAFINHMDGVAQARQLQKTGLAAQATILRIWDTGMTVNDDPVVGFLLEVRPPGGAPYQAETKLLVSRLSIPQVQPGAIVPVRYDPAVPSHVSLELGPREPLPQRLE